MAIPRPLAEFLCHEHRYRPLPKSILLLGRQTVLLSPQELEALGEKFGLKVTKADIDTITTTARNYPDRQLVSDESFFALLGVEEIRAIDVSDFEGADLIYDVCGELPTDLEGRFDFIFNGSVFDNVFNPATAMINVGRMLADNGRVVHVETASNNPYAYSILSPSWFFDYAVVNRFADCKVYMGTTRTFEGLQFGPWGMMAFDPNAQTRPDAFMLNLGGEIGVSVTVAERGKGSSWDRRPIQSHYRSDDDWSTFVDQCAAFRASRRPPFLGAGATEGSGGTPENPWVSCGWW